MSGKERCYSIFGAGMVAVSIAEILVAFDKKEPLYFVVSHPQENPPEILGKPVLGWEEYLKRRETDELLLLAIPEPSQEEIVNQCKEAVVCFQCITSEIENQLFYDYYQSSSRFPVFSTVTTLKKENNLEKLDIGIYMATGVWDKVLKREYAFSELMIPIQVGAALDKKSVAAVQDNSGINISTKNPYYCELTALYWIWKNTKHQYAGLCHYRRWYTATGAELREIFNGGADAVLTYPSLQYPSAHTHEKRYIGAEVRRIIREVLEAGEPNERIGYEEVMKDKYIYNFNMLIAKKTVLDEYCEWLFAVINEIEQRCSSEKIEIQKRQQGYWGEVLMTYYFMKKRKDLKLIHMGRKILV